MPTGGSVAAGSATIGIPSNGTLNVNQTSNRAVIDWTSFSIGRGGTVNFNQPGASSATLNRVTGSTPSTIAGTINAPGTVLLVNPNGIAISKTGVVNVGSFAASTLDIKNSDFMAGNYKFTGNGASAAVTNAGRINVADGGFAALLGGQVANDGVISARLGRVGLGSGELITLDLAGDGFLSVGVPTSALGKISGSDGKALVSNKGKIVADGGTVYLSAATAAGILRDAINVPGSIRANSVGTQNGRIVIGGGAGGKVSVSGKVAANGGRSGKGNGGTVDVSGATVAVSGQISANGRKGGGVMLAAGQSVDIWGSVSAKGTTDAGGTIVVTAHDIKLASEAVLDAGGASGGTVLVGGDYQGGANAANNFVTYPILNAFATTVAAGAQIKADGSNGAGGKIVVWSDDHTTFAGAVSAQGNGSGQGGFAEVSGHRLLDFTGTANLLAANGAAGTLLLDPRNVTISTGTTAGGSIASGTFTPSADDSILNVTTLQTALASGNVIVTTGASGSAGSQTGDITVATPVTWSSHTLTLDAYHSINVNATMSATGTAGLALKTNDGGSGGSLNFNGGNVTFASTSQALSINGASYTLLNSMTGVQNINNGLSSNYALANSLNATGVSSFVPIGTDSAGNIVNSGNGFTGNFNGLGNTISNLTINRSSVDNVGLFGVATGGSISSLALTNVNVAGGNHTGALLGYDISGTSLWGLSASGTVSGQYQTGGLIGWLGQGATLTGGSAAVSVTSPLDDVGGLIGLTIGNVLQSYATGAVTGRTSVGGLIGRANTDFGGSVTVQQSYATGAASGAFRVGGLIGSTDGADQVTVQQSFATGPASGQYFVGGLIGQTGANPTTVQQSYATGWAGASGGYAGGLIGYNDKTLSIGESYATGFVSAPGFTGGLVGHGATAPTVTSSYWDLSTTGQAGAFNGGSLSGASGAATSVRQAALPGGWSSAVWGIVAGKSYPFFLWQYPAAGGAPQVISGNAYTNAGSTAAAGATVSALVNGAGVGSATAGANGYYNILVAPNTIAANSQVAAYTTGASGGLTYQQNAPAGSLAAFNIAGTNLMEISRATTLSAVSAGLATAIGSTGVSTSYADRWIIAQGASFTIDQAITQSGILRLSAAGDVTQAAGASLNTAFLSLQLITGGANFTLLDTGNKVTNLAITSIGSGSLSLYDSVDLNVGSSVTANGGVSIQTPGTLTIANTISSSASGNAIVLVAGNKFTNNLGASALSAPNGRWLVYSSNPTSDTFKNLDSGNTAVWNSTYAANAPATIASGNRYVFAYQPTATFTSSNASKSYGATADVSASFSVSGINGGVTNAYLADTAAVAYSGAPTLTSAGTAASATVAGGPYLIDISQGSVTGLNGYAVSFVDSGMLTVSKASLAVTANDASKTYDGLAFSGGNGVSYSGFVNGESASVLGGTLTYGGTAQGAKNAGSYTLVASGLSSSNYTISYVGGTLSIGKAALTVTANDASKTYNGLAFSGGNGVTYSGFVNGESASVLGGTLSYGGTAQGAKNAGSYTLTASGLSSSNYTISYAAGALTIGKAALTVTANDASKTYDGLAFSGGNGVSYAGFVNGESASVLGGALAYGGTAQGAKNAGSYTLTASGLASSNYAISYTGGALIIGKAALTVTANDAGKTYDGQVFSGGNGVSYSGFVNGETSSVLGGTLSYGGSAQGAVNAGSYGLTASGLTSSNYTIGYAAGALSITPRSITVAANAQSKTYGDADPTLAYGVTSGNLVSGDSLSGALTRASGENVGSYGITQGTLTAGSNYALTYSGANLGITPRAITVTANAQSKTYGDADPTLTYGVTSGNFVSGDSLSGALTRASGENVGSYGITQGTLTAGSNYALTYSGASLGITPRAITVTANAQSKTYGDADPTLTYGLTSGNLVSGDSLGGVLSRASGENVGTYGITQGTLTAGNNYALTYAGANLGITPRAITITANAQSKIYGDADPTLTYGVTSGNLVSGDSLSGVLSRASGENVGSYGITQGTLAAGSNYALTYAGANLGITPRPITVAADNLTKTYGTPDPTLTYTIGGRGLVAGDNIASVFSGGLTRAAGETVAGGPYAITQGTLTANGNYSIATFTAGQLTIAPANVTVSALLIGSVVKTYDGSTVATLDASNLGLSGVQAGDVGSVIVTAASASYDNASAGINKTVTAVGLTLSGSAASNYLLTSTTVQANIGTIGQRAITVTANAQSKTYGNVDPTLTYGVTSGNLVGGDSLSGVLTRASGENVGSYGITQGSLSAGSNYALTYAGANLGITPRAITVMANAQSKIYGDADPTLTYGVTSGNLVSGDSLSGVLSRASGENVGSYGIAQGTLTAGSNYALTYAGANLGITQRAITVTANAQSKIYGDADPTLTYGITTGNLVGSDSLSGALTRTAGENVGSYGIIQGTLTAGGNYALTYAGANLGITQRAITVTANAQNKIYGDADPTLTYGVTSGNLVSGDSLSGVLARASGENVGSYGITRGTLTAGSNYALTYAGANLGITPRSITVTANAQSKIYGDTDPTLTYGVTSGKLVGSDSLSGVLARAAGENVGAYGIAQGTLTAGSNYALTYAGANLRITQRAITVTASTQSKTYGDADPTLTYGVTSGNLVSGDSLSGVLSRASGENVGTYGIAQGTLTAGSNYALTYTGANLGITPRPITVAADDQTKNFGAADPVLTYRITAGQLVKGDLLSGTLTRTAGEDAGDYAILQGGLSTGSNYTLSYVGGTLTIIAPLTSGYASSRHQAASAGNSPPVVNVSYQAGGNTAAARIGVVGGPVSTAANGNGGSNTRNVAAATPAADVNQNIETGSGAGSLFPPISQFDRLQYAKDELPPFAPQAAESTVLTMIARAAAHDRREPKINLLWREDAPSWTEIGAGVAKSVTFGDGAGGTRTPASDAGFAFVNGTTDIAALLRRGPVMLGGEKPADAAAPTAWLLALQLTADGKGIVANDPVTGRQVVLAYDPATKMVGTVAEIVDPSTGKLAALGDSVPDVGETIKIPAEAWAALKAFKPATYLAVSL
nr:MBG domain-containing protein [Bradyrhizobium japonicum]